MVDMIDCSVGYRKASSEDLGNEHIRHMLNAVTQSIVATRSLGSFMDGTSRAIIGILEMKPTTRITEAGIRSGMVLAPRSFVRARVAAH